MSIARETLRKMTDLYPTDIESVSRSNDYRIAHYILGAVEMDRKVKPEVIDLVCELEDQEWGFIKAHMANYFTDACQDSDMSRRARAKIAIADSFELMRAFS